MSDKPVGMPSRTKNIVLSDKQHEAMQRDSHILGMESFGEIKRGIEEYNFSFNFNEE